MKIIKVNEEIPENACIIVLNWKGKRYSKGCLGKHLPLKIFKQSIESLSKATIRTLEYIENKK
ncbi:hypothetical protein M0R04_15480 [Candidatus Dojkabacteria bacterium]|jgi:hypothetical protein|nr:hypothetical protein [Candidatus Dojkabacteria bacterium]